MTPPNSIDTVEVLDRHGQPSAMLVIDESHGPAPLLSPRRAAALVEAALAACLRQRGVEEARSNDARAQHAR